VSGTSAAYSVIDSPICTSISLTSGANPSNYGNPVTLTATLSPYASGGASANGDIVTFMNGSSVLGQGTLASGVATLTTSRLPVGSDQVQADFAGTSYFAASTGAAFSQTVRPVTLTVTGSNLSRAYGTSTPALTGGVSGAENGDAFTVTGTATATQASPVGAYPVTPQVSGANLADYTVDAVNGTLTVTQAASAIALASSASSAFVSNAVTFTATLNSASGAPPGTVSFYDGQTDLLWRLL